MLINLHEIFGAFSGLYVDNGKDQTVIQRSITRREKLKFEREMLNLLGLPRKPRRSLSHNVTLASSAPKFLLDIYESLDGSKLKNEFNLKKEDFRSVKESDAIMTFLTKNNHVNNVRHERGRRLWFDVSEVPAGDTVVGAELRLYKLRNDEDYESLMITIYRVVFDYNGGEELEYAATMNTTSDYEGWLVFNVTSAFISWIGFPSSNRGFYIAVHKHDQPNYEVHPDAAGIISTINEDTEDQPFMVAFFKYANNMRSRTRRIREAPKRKKKSDVDVSYSTNPFTSESAWTLRNCQIQTLYVNFKDLNWHEWIIAPDGYAAYYCSGLCDFPLNAHMNATNHAIVQTLVHLINPLEAPKPCCAPTKLGSIAVLYYLEDNNVILKKYKNMIVKSCGCH